MELPFAVEASGVVDDGGDPISSSLQHSESSSLVTASSQGSLLPPNTPHDVVLPSQYAATCIPPPPLPSHGEGQLVVNPASPPEKDGYGGKGDPENDFTYVNISETDADDDDDDEMDILIEGVDISFPQDHQQQQYQQQHRGDVLAALLSGMQPSESDAFMSQTEAANDASTKASLAKKQGDLLSALDYHSKAAKLYKDCAVAVRDRNASLANSLLMLSQTQARSAIALKSIVKLNPTELRSILPPSSGTDALDPRVTVTLSHKERLRAAVRGALGSRHPHEADISESQFLGDAHITTAGPSSATRNSTNDDTNSEHEGTLLTEGQESPSSSSANPVDEMMELERELRDMDMALELGNSISSLDSRMHHRMKNSIVDGSFMVVPPGSQSYMASSMWNSGHVPITNARIHPTATQTSHGTAGVRARANRVQNMLEASTTPANRHHSQLPHHIMPPASANKNAAGLESSWWGNASTTSQILASSVISLGGRTGADGFPMNDGSGQSSSANTKQIMRLMDSLKTLGDENAALLREVEELEAARAEAKAARDSMRKFKNEYGKRFTSLKKALEKFRQEHPNGNTNSSNPVNNSDFMRSASVSDQMQRQEQLIRKLTADLKKEKDESKKKDAALRKYESFYREVKARSAQKAAQRQMESQQQQQRRQTPRVGNPPRSTHR